MRTLRHHRSEMLRRGSATAADDTHPVFGDEAEEMLGQAIRPEVVVHRPVHHGREASVGQT